jgi:hypothetical protein
MNLYQKTEAYKEMERKSKTQYFTEIDKQTYNQLPSFSRTKLKYKGQVCYFKKEGLLKKL